MRPGREVRAPESLGFFAPRRSWLATDRPQAPGLGTCVERVRWYGHPSRSQDPRYARRQKSADEQESARPVLPDSGENGYTAPVPSRSFQNLRLEGSIGADRLPLKALARPKAIGQ